MLPQTLAEQSCEQDEGFSPESQTLLPQTLAAQSCEQDEGFSPVSQTLLPQTLAAQSWEQDEGSSPVSQTLLPQAFAGQSVGQLKVDSPASQVLFPSLQVWQSAGQLPKSSPDWQVLSPQLAGAGQSAGQLAVVSTGPSQTLLPQTLQLLGDPAQLKPDSIWQLASQPSPVAVPPSSQASDPTRMPSPQMGVQALGVPLH